MKKSKYQSNYAFIDSQNLKLGVKSLGWELDFEKFFIFLRHKYKVTKAYLFIGMLPGNEKLYKDLEKIGYKLILKPTLLSYVKKSKKKIVKGNVDAELVLHTMIEYQKFNKAIIVSGDGDFYCLVEYLEAKNKLEKLITPNRKYSSLLKEFARYIIKIEDFKSKVEGEKE